MHLSALHIYPVKSCRGHSVASAELDAWGLVGDRRFVVATPEGKFVTQRQLPRMALIETEFTGDSLALASAHSGAVTVSLAALQANPSPVTRSVTVWKDTMIADDCGEDAAAWLTAFLCTPLRLLHMGESYHRPVKPAKAVPGDVVSFADGYPFLVISEESLADLNDRLQESGSDSLPMNRFRPNLVVAGCAPYAEDTWTRIKVGDSVFRNAGLCARCIVTTTDQLTAERGKEPLKTLASYRRDAIDPTDVNFGTNLIHETKTGTLRVGARVELA